MSQAKPKPVTEVILRSYPKIIFFWPLLITSFVLWLLQLLVNDPVAWYGNFWLIVFFINLFITAFDFSSTKFFVLVLVIVVVILLVIFLVFPNFGPIALPSGEFNPGLTADFYLVMTIVIGFILLLVFIGSRFDYWKIERNEIYHKAGIFSSAERIPTKSLRIKKSIPDVFEFFLLRAGKIQLYPGQQDVIELTTVLNINKKAEHIDWLLSYISVEPDEIDGA